MKEGPQELALVAQQSEALAAAQGREMSPREMFSGVMAMINSGKLTSEGVQAASEALKLAERLEDRKAERLYAAALGKLQAECQNVVATKDVDGKFRYAPFLDIWNAVRPAVERNQFTLQWSQEHLGDKIAVHLTLQHTPGGHKRDFNYAMRLGTNAPGTPAGAQNPVLDSITESRAKRRLLMDALNIVVDAVTPAEDLGDGSFANQEESDALFQRLMALEPDPDKQQASQKRFLATAGAESWNKIPRVFIPILQRLMADKERAKKAKP